MLAKERWNSTPKHFIGNMRPFEAAIMVQAAASLGRKLTFDYPAIPPYKNYVATYIHDWGDTGDIWTEYRHLLYLAQLQNPSIDN